MKLLTKLISVLLLAALVSTAFAGNAWIRFDNDSGASAGTTIYSPATFTDENGNHNASLAMESLGMTYTWSSDVPNSQIYDPVTDTTYTNSLSFSSGQGEGFADYFISLNNSMNLPMANSANPFTVEMFFKSEEVYNDYGHGFEFVDEASADKIGFYTGIDERDMNIKIISSSLSTTNPKAYYVDANWYPCNQQWHHYAVTWDGTTMKTYLDYGEQSSVTVAEPWVITDTRSAFNIGSFYSDAKQSGNSFEGYIDEVRVTDQVLTSDQFLQCDGVQVPEGFYEGTDYGLIAYYNFEEGSGTTLTDHSGNGKDGTWFNKSGNANYSTDVPTTLTNSTQAGYFSRIDKKNGDYVDVSSLKLAANALDGGVTVAFWVKNEGDQKHWIVSEVNSNISKHPDYSFGINCAEDEYASIGIIDDSNHELLDSNEVSTTQKVANATEAEWHHIAWTDNNGELKLYVDGVLDSTDFTYDPEGRTLLTDTTTIGAWLRSPDNPDYCFEGLIDDFAAWDLVLTDAQIAALATGTSPLTVLSSQIPGDANGDGKVDGSDVTILANHWQEGVGAPDPMNITWDMGDFNGDGQIDGSDVTILANHWQEGVTSGTAAVPEPSTLVLLLAAVAGLYAIRCRK